MFLHTEYVEPRLGYKLFVQFNNGISGEIDLTDVLWGEVFEPLHDQTLFMTAKQNAVMRTVVWDNGADFAPEFLLDLYIQQSGLVA